MQSTTFANFLTNSISNTISKATKILLTLVIAGSLFTFFGINAQAQDSSLFALISDDSQFSILKEAVQKAGLESNLSKTDGDKYTLLAPSNQAFEKLPKPVLENLLKDENKESLLKLLKYHLLNDIVSGVQIVSGKTLKTVEGSEVSIKLTSSQILLNDKVNISKIDIKAANGVLHIIDDVLIPTSINIEAIASGIAPSQASQSNQLPELSSESANSPTVESSPVNTETPRTGASFLLPISLMVLGIIGAGLRLISRPVKVKIN